nr:hypothetical protein [Trichocoleus sp. FACHB-591]
MATLVVMAIAFRLYSYTFAGNITGFFHIGNVLPLSPYLQGQDVLVNPSGGYDGQMFLSLALDPFLQADGTIQALDNPPYRYRRILYPLLGYFLGFGNSQFIPYALVAINCFSIISIVFFIGLTIHHYKSSISIYQSLFALTVPGVWIVLSLSTADLLNNLFLVVAIYFYRSFRPVYTTTLLAAACLTRETTLLIWLAFIATSFYEQKWQQLKHLFWAWIPLGIWSLYVAKRLPPQPTDLKIEGFDFFLAGILKKFLFSIKMGPIIGNLVEVGAFILLISVLLTGLFILYKQPQNNQIILSNTLIYSLIFSVSSMGILMFQQGYNRVFVGAYFLLLLTLSPQLSFLKVAIATFASVITAKYLIDLLV